MMAAKHVLAIHTDSEAIGRATSAVIGDLHEVILAVIEEIRRRHKQSEAV